MPTSTSTSHPRNSTLSQLYVHLIFAVKGQESHILSHWQQPLYRYIGGIVRKKGQALLAINGTSDHVHLLVSIKASCCIADLVREIKKATNRYINRRHWTAHRFYWQEGYGAFSYAPSTLPSLLRHISRQATYHQRVSFETEYRGLLEHFGIAYEPAYLFEWSVDASQQLCYPCTFHALIPTACHKKYASRS